MTAQIFDIIRTSTVDGPGIRTAVFFKGCNLACRWCHNPESQHRENELFLDCRKCIGCGSCARVCTCSRTDCTACGACAAVCPTGAINSFKKLPKKEAAEKAAAAKKAKAEAAKSKAAEAYTKSADCK